MKLNLKKKRIINYELVDHTDVDDDFDIQFAMHRLLSKVRFECMLSL